MDENTLHRRAGLSENDYKTLESELLSKGFIKVDNMSSLSVGQYKTSTYTGTVEDFGDTIKYNVEWLI